MSKTYFGMIQHQTFLDRLKYLLLYGTPTEETFGGARFINQAFYKSRSWQMARSRVIVRDNGCDLGIADRPIAGPIYVHHITPVDVATLMHDVEFALTSDNLVCVSMNTHQIIHYAKRIPEELLYVERVPGDTNLW